MFGLFLEEDSTPQQMCVKGCELIFFKTHHVLQFFFKKKKKYNRT